MANKIEGNIPLIRKTADQLKVGTHFLGSVDGDGPETEMYVEGDDHRDEKSIRFAPSMRPSDFPPYKWVVIEEYGPFQKPEGE